MKSTQITAEVRNAENRRTAENREEEHQEHASFLANIAKPWQKSYKYNCLRIVEVRTF